MSPAAADGDGRRAPQLTRRQVEILCLVATGASNRAIGEQLGLREQTVKNHLWEATRKLGVDDRTHAVLEAMRLEIIEVPVDPTAPLMAIPIEP